MLTTFDPRNCPPEKVTKGILVAFAIDDGIYYGVIDEPYSTNGGVEKAKIKFYKEKDSEFRFREKPEIKVEKLIYVIHTCVNMEENKIKNRTMLSRLCRHLVLTCDILFTSIYIYILEADEDT